MSETPSTLALMDWKRTVGRLYAEVREAGGGGGAVERFRARRDALFRSHRCSPVPEPERGDYPGVPYFPYRRDLRTEAALEPEVDGPTLVIPSSTEEPITFRRLGLVSPDLDAGPVRLAIYWLEGYGGGLFLPFRDATAGSETYGAGRYLLDTIKGADLGMSADGERLVLDFNYAYNPSCSYDPRWSCPLAPPENRFDVAVEAGERMPTG